MVAAVQLEKQVASTCILGIIISKLSHEQELSQIILLKIDKSPKIGLHGTLLRLRTTVSLRVKSSGEPPLDAKKVAER